MKLTAETKELISIIIALLFILFIGTFLFMWLEDWHFIDALYFATATLTTVGFGDVVPLTYTGKLFGVIYMWIGVTIALYSITYLGSHIIAKRIKERSNEHFHFPWHKHK
ncbi:MAG: potassium channel family protein [Candidatus Pacebacteria bacterium]|nr:potassium channel family protein [Candidatus Paceibacterota bacterium]